MDAWFFASVSIFDADEDRRPLSVQFEQLVEHIEQNKLLTIHNNRLNMIKALVFYAYFALLFTSVCARSYRLNSTDVAPQDVDPPMEDESDDDGRAYAFSKTYGKS